MALPLLRSMDKDLPHQHTLPFNKMLTTKEIMLHQRRLPHKHSPLVPEHQAATLFNTLHARDGGKHYLSASITLVSVASYEDASTT
jgi:hypothetical protein